VRLASLTKRDSARKVTTNPSSIGFPALVIVAPPSDDVAHPIRGGGGGWRCLRGLGENVGRGGGPSGQSVAVFDDERQVRRRNVVASVGDSTGGTMSKMRRRMAGAWLSRDTCMDWVGGSLFLLFTGRILDGLGSGNKETLQT
jgi:hypothetical protein